MRTRPCSILEDHGFPLVSVGLPVHNGERFLTACLDSLIAQTYPNCEIIVSDNASTDGTPRICEELARCHRHIRYVRADRNRGATWNHSRVLELARGVFFKWCGADDVVAPRFMLACVETLRTRPDAVLAFPRTVVIDVDGQPVRRTMDHLPVDSQDAVVRFRSLLSALSITQNVFYGVMRKDCLKRARPFGAFLAADRCLLAELALMGPFVEVPEYLMFRRQHTGNLTRTNEDEQRFYDPRTGRRFRPREWGVLREHLTSVVRAPLGSRTKLRLLSAVAAWVFTMREHLSCEARQQLVEVARRLGLLPLRQLDAGGRVHEAAPARKQEST